MRGQADRIQETMHAVLVAHGVPEPFARIQSALLLEAQMRGYASHGVLRLPRIIERIVNGVSSPVSSGIHEWGRRLPASCRRRTRARTRRGAFRVGCADRACPALRCRGRRDP